MLEAARNSRGCFRKRRFVEPASARAGAPVLEQGRAMARGQILENHIAPAVATLKDLMLQDASKRQSQRAACARALENYWPCRCDSTQPH